MAPVPLPTIPGGYYARIDGKDGGYPCGNTFAWLCSPAPTVPADDLNNAQLVADTMANHWPAFATAVFNTEYNANEVIVYALGQPTSAPKIRGMIAAGGKVGERAPVKLARLVSKKTDTRGRGHTGRNFIGAMTIPMLDGDGIDIVSSAWSELDTAYQAFITSCKTDLAAAGGGSVWQETVLSKKGAGSMLLINTNATQHQVVTQRSRAK